MKAAAIDLAEVPVTSPDVRGECPSAQRPLPIRSNNEIEPVVEEAADITARMVTMLPAELLQPTEIIVLMLKPSAWFILLSCIGTLIGIIIAAAIALALIDRNIPIGIGRKDVVLLAMGLMAARLFWQFLEWLSRVYVLTDRRVIRVRGVLRVSVFEAPIKLVQHTNTFFSLRERFFGLGTIGFATAGTGIVEAHWEMLPQPLEVHRIVVQTLNRYR